MGSEGGSCRVRLKYFRDGRLPALKYKLVCHFRLAADIVGVAFREFLYDGDGPGF